MKFKCEVTQCQLLPPWYYGYAYINWYYSIMVFYIMPINYVIRAYMFIKYKWNRFRGTPSYIDLMIEKVVIDLMIEKVVHEREERRVVELRNMTERLELIEDKLIMNGLITDD